MKGRARIPIFVVSAILVLLLISVGERRYSTAGLSTVREGYSWIVRFGRVPLEFLTGIWENYIYLINTRQENNALRSRLAVLEVQNMSLNQMRWENQRLRAMLDFKQSYPNLPLRPAEVIAQDLSLVFKTVIVDKGARAGFYKDMPIIKPAGLVGRVIATSATTAQVLLITDINSAVPALIESTRVKGIVKGLGDGNLSLEYVKSDEDIKVGDFVVTSGLGGVYPNGIPVGTVRTIKRYKHKMFAVIILTPSVEIGKIEEVFGIGRDVAQTD